ncbi:hypothetical protein [Allorhizocola rhizosphaerae]|uniref:hypothetical protein n=1 Tax=Allorhizocola rhizosphaerae TaxID=1872709 RepID=UPI000E3BD637|nr:hypothetical protein [Allorhizocola rhizosphaerae]
MSLVQDLADRLRATCEALPVAEIAGAAERLRTAGGLLAWVTHESARPTAMPSLSSAAAHLDHAAAALRVAQDALDEYRAVLGLPAESYPDGRLRTVPAQVKRKEQAHLSDWWSVRVAELTGLAETRSGEGATSSNELLQLCVEAALDNDAERLHTYLSKAGPAVGLGLAAVAPPLLRHLGMDLVGHPPRLEDFARLRRAALPVVADVLPKLPSDAAEEIVARVCHARPQRQSSQPAHPVDIAAASALLVAGMLKANGRKADDLSDVVELERAAADEANQRAMERARSHRAALRITDNARRRSAVDELRPAAP